MWAGGPGSPLTVPVLTAVLVYARDGGVVVVHARVRLGRLVRDSLTLIQDLTERGGAVRHLAVPIKVGFSGPNSLMAQLTVAQLTVAQLTVVLLAVVLLALFGRVERAYTVEGVAHVRVVATAKARWIGWSSLVGSDKLADVAHLHESAHAIAGIVAGVGITCTTLERDLSRR